MRYNRGLLGDRGATECAHNICRCAMSQVVRQATLKTTYLLSMGALNLIPPFLIPTPPLLFHVPGPLSFLSARKSLSACRYGAPWPCAMFGSPPPNAQMLISSASIASCAKAGLGVLGGRNCDCPAAPESGEFRSALRDCREAGERESDGKLMSSYDRPKYELLKEWEGNVPRNSEHTSS